MKDRVLAFGCHPDDVEFMAAGTLALLTRQGYEIHIATMTGGEVGSPSLSRDAIRHVRLQEAAASAAVLAGRYHYAGGCDLEVEYNDFYRKAATRIMREVDPLIVFTNPPMDYLADHEQTSLLVRNAAYIASVPLYDCGSGASPTKRFPYLYYWNAIGLHDIFGRRLPLHCVVDVTPAMATKEMMLACHASQRDWLAAHNGWDSYIQTMKEMSAGQGQLVGRANGEGFIQHRGNGHPADDILKEILGDACVSVHSNF
jgi:N-acetylglucosamine malate deacetylase 1